MRPLSKNAGVCGPLAGYLTRAVGEPWRRVLRAPPLVNPPGRLVIEESGLSLPRGHVAAVGPRMQSNSARTRLARQPSRWRELAVALIAARVIDPQSKLATARALAPDLRGSTLGEMLGLGGVDQHELYAAMDWLVERQAVENAWPNHLEDHTLVLYDLTSSYLEGTRCPLARRGHSRDGKKGTPQIVFGLLCTSTGCPVAVEVRRLDSGPVTVASQVDKLRQHFGLKRVVLVGDRGMLTAARIREDLAGVDGLRWITTLRAPTIRKLGRRHAAAVVVRRAGLAEITSEESPANGSSSAATAAAAERGRKRQALLQATEKELEPIAAATRRKTNPLRGGRHRRARRQGD